MIKNSILGIDLGTEMGIAFIDADGKVLTSGHYSLKGKGIESPGMRFKRAGDIFRAEIETFKPDIIAYEAVKRWMSSSAAFVYNGLLAQLFIVADECKVDYVGYAPTEVKKNVTGKGRASKEEVIAWVHNTYPHLKHITDDNEADAIAIAWTGWNK